MLVNDHISAYVWSTVEQGALWMAAQGGAREQFGRFKMDVMTDIVWKTLCALIVFLFS